MSSLIYFGHMWARAVASTLLRFVNGHLIETPVYFVFALVIAVCAGIIVIWLSGKEKFKWLKMIY